MLSELQFYNTKLNVEVSLKTNVECKTHSFEGELTVERIYKTKSLIELHLNTILIFIFIWLEKKDRLYENKQKLWRKGRRIR